MERNNLHRENKKDGNHPHGADPTVPHDLQHFFPGAGTEESIAAIGHPVEMKTTRKNCKQGHGQNCDKSRRHQRGNQVKQAATYSAEQQPDHREPYKAPGQIFSFGAHFTRQGQDGQKAYGGK